MGARWQCEGTGQRAVALVALALESRHGVLAAEIAEFFATAHRLKGDAGRSRAWAGVAKAVRRRTQARLAAPSLSSDSCRG